MTWKYCNSTFFNKLSFLSLKSVDKDAAIVYNVLHIDNHYS